MSGSGLNRSNDRVVTNMEKLQQIITHHYFSYLYVFVVIFCVISLLVLPQGHPLITYAVAVGIAMFALQQYRKYLLKRRS